MLNFVDDRGAFRGNLVEYRVISGNSVELEFGGGVKLRYQVVEDSVFDKHFGNKFASYSPGRQFREDFRAGWNDYYPNGDVPIVRLRESLLSSDRASTAIFHHEYFELQGLNSKLSRELLTPTQVNSYIDDLHVGAVNSADRLIGRMIISEGM
ncbi:MAG: hypothetical protein OEZ68_03225 [Gammaproteobacteria bacterium]|nr:hypothetical protein [Gammaproteobacteria bacterium]MDH5799795.1 hypothetical protein [Gammaproteobacteria bacterium]